MSKTFITRNLTGNRHKFGQAANVIEETHFCLDLEFIPCGYFGTRTRGF